MPETFKSRRVAVLTVPDANSSTPGNTAESTAAQFIASGAGEFAQRELRLSANSAIRQGEPFAVTELCGGFGGLEVCICELAWADVSKSRPTIVSILRQLLAFAPRLLAIGRAGLCDARQVDPGSLGRLPAIFEVAVWLLGWFMPFANATLLLAFGIAGVLVQPAAVLRPVALAAALLVGGAAAGWATYRARCRVGQLVPILLGALASSAVSWFGGRLTFGAAAPQALLFILAFAGGSGALLWALRQAVTPSPRWLHPAMPFALLSAAIGYYGSTPEDAEERSNVWGVPGLQSVVLDITSLLACAWALVLLLAIALEIHALWVRPRGNARRAWVAARLGFAAHFSLLVFVQAFILFFLREFESELGVKAFMPSGCVHFVLDALSFGWPALMGTCIALVAIVALIVLLPSLSAEFGGATSPIPEAASSAVNSGLWLSHGRRTLSVLIRGATPVVLIGNVALFFLAAEYPELSASLAEAHAVFWHLVLPAGVALLVGLVRSPSGLEHAWPTLSLLLDIDAYWRQSPSRVRASILARGHALFALLERCDLICVAAHGQGSLIALDLLAERADAKSTANDRVALLTFGSPLRALYAELLPYRVLDLAERARVRRWHNLFWAGDYVGRSLWQDESDEKVYRERWREGSRAETCLGFGGHSGYWSSPELGRIMREVIQEEEAHERVGK